MEHGAAGDGPSVHQAVAFALYCLDHDLVGGLIGPRRAGRRHRAGPQHAQQRLPRGTALVEIGEVQVLKVQPLVLLECHTFGTFGLRIFAQSNFSFFGQSVTAKKRA
jgi:hypothetical protein